MAEVRAYLELFRLFLFVGILCFAAYYDLREARIPNKLCLLAVCGGGAFALLTGILAGVDFEGPGLVQGALGALGRAGLGLLAGGGPMMVIYLLGVGTSRHLIGAGDVKLLAGIGTFTGPLGALLSIYYTLFIAGFIAMFLVLVCLFRRKEKPKTLPFGALIALGTLAAFCAQFPIFSSFLELARNLN